MSGFDEAFLADYQRRNGAGSVKVTSGPPLGDAPVTNSGSKKQGKKDQNLIPPISKQQDGQNKTNKNNAVATTVDGIRFASKWEAEYYGQLKLRQRAGEFPLFLQQVPIILPGMTPAGKQRNSMSVDFMIVHDLSAVEFIDAKGKVERDWHLRKCMAEGEYGIEIKLVKRQK